MADRSADFSDAVDRALNDPSLQSALGNVRSKFIGARAKARDDLPEFDLLRDRAVAIKRHATEHLDIYLDRFTKQAKAQGTQVHFAADASEAIETILQITRATGAKKVTKGKSMLSEEINLNAHLENDGVEVIETDLGEYIIKLRGEKPSHIIAPAVHVNQSEVAEDFRTHHTHLDARRDLSEPTALLAEARAVLRQHFLSADVAITGANFLIAQTGSAVLVTNEGNGDLAQTMAPCHIIVAAIDKIIPRLNDCAVLLRVLSRSATGQELTVYTTFAQGPRRPFDVDGPAEHHIVLVDNGRSAFIGTELEPLLRCIRCGACMNHCPIYQSIGGHAYGWVYPGPIGAALTPALVGHEQSADLPSASTLCGRCEAVCPVRIPIPRILRYWRRQTRPLASFRDRWLMSLWAFFAARPWLYRIVFALAPAPLFWMGRKRGKLSWVPFMNSWLSERDLPSPSAPLSFQAGLKREALR